MDVEGSASQEVWLTREQIAQGGGLQLLKDFLKRLRE